MELTSTQDMILVGVPSIQQWSTKERGLSYLVRVKVLNTLFMVMDCGISGIAKTSSCIFKVGFYEYYLYSALKFLLESGVDVNMQDDFSSVHRMARQKGYDANAGILVDTHRNIRYYMTYTVAHIRDRDFSNRFKHGHNFSGFTALHYAVLIGDNTIIKLLLEHGNY